LDGVPFVPKSFHLNVALDARHLSLSHLGASTPTSLGHAVLNRIKERLNTRERLSDEIRAILEKQEMAAERLVNYVRAIFALMSLSAVVFVSPDAQTPTATTIFRWILTSWIAYAALTFFLLRRRDRYYRWLKYLSISVDMTILSLNAVGFLYNHSSVYEVYRSPINWVVIAAFNVMAGLRYSVAACLYSAALVVIQSTAFLAFAINQTHPPLATHAVYLGEGLLLEDIAYTIIFTAINGVFAAVIASNSRKLIVQSATESLQRERLEQDRDRLAKYFSKDVVDLVLNNPESLGQGGQRMVATVLFADIRNFTQLSTVMQPEQVVELLNRYFSTMVDIIFKNGGTLDKFLGDGLMALFGVPYSLDKPEERAVRTALEMLEALQIMNRELEAKGMLRLDIGVGINAGPVVAGNIGSSQRHEYTVIGDTVNLAARLEALNKETRTQILVSASVYDAIRNTFRTRQLGPLRIRGKPEPLDVFAVMPPDSDLDATPASMIPASSSFV
jgi:adenylate cyclase